MTDSEIHENYQKQFPVNFKVIGIGNGVTDIIEKVKSFGYDSVGCFIANTPSDCTPIDDDLMVIIVAKDNEELANAIAKTYHDARVLTIGLVHNADFSCYDSVAIDTDCETFPEVIRTLLSPLVTVGHVCLDYNDICLTLRKSGFFKTLVSDGKSIEEAVTEMQRKIENIAVDRVENITAILYLNHEKWTTLTMDDMSPFFSNVIYSLPESINVIWSVNFDGTLRDDLIRFKIITSGKGL